MKKALITGITGQDWAYLAEFLLDKGYEVHWIKRRSSLFNTDRIDHLYQDPHNSDRRLFLHYWDMTDSANLIKLVSEIAPNEIYNLAAQSHVAVSFQMPEYTANTDALGTLRLLEAIKEAYSVRDFIDHSFSEVGITIRWAGKGVEEKWYNAKTGECLVEVDPQYFRPAEVDFLLWDPTKAKEKLWWSSEYTLEKMCREMVKADIELFKQQKILKEQWFTILSQYE